MIRGEVPALIIDETDEVLVISSLENHPLIIPKKHIPNVYTLDEKTAAMVMSAAIKVANALKKALNCDGVNLVQSNETAAGQEVFHFHMHVKPRWVSDDVILKWNTNEVPKEKRTEITNLIRKALTY